MWNIHHYSILLFMYHRYPYYAIHVSWPLYVGMWFSSPIHYRSNPTMITYRIAPPNCPQILSKRLCQFLNQGILTCINSWIKKERDLTLIELSMGEKTDTKKNQNSSPWTRYYFWWKDNQLQTHVTSISLELMHIHKRLGCGLKKYISTSIVAHGSTNKLEFGALNSNVGMWFKLSASKKRKGLISHPVLCPSLSSFG